MSMRGKKSVEKKASLKGEGLRLGLGLYSLEEKECKDDTASIGYLEAANASKEEDRFHKVTTASGLLSLT
jgi:hypothetical protein